MRFKAAVFLLSAVLLTACATTDDDPPSEIPGDDDDTDPGNPIALSCGEMEVRTPTSVEKLICAQPGGHICTPDQTVCLEFPPRSLDVNRRIKLSQAGPEFEIDGKDQLFPGARMEPHGISFLQPVKVVVRPRGAADINEVSVLTASAPDSYEDLQNMARDDATQTITGEIWRFSWLYPYLVNGAPAAAPPSLSLHSGPGSANWGVVGNGDVVTVGLAVNVVNGVYQWGNGGTNSQTLVLQGNFPTATAGQTAHATITIVDPGPYTGVGPNAPQMWRQFVFNKIFGVLQGGTHPSGADGITIYPTQATDIRWDSLPAGYPSGTAQADLQFFDAGGNLIGTSTLLLTVSRP